MPPIPCPHCSQPVVAQVCSRHGGWVERPSLLKLIDDIERQGLTRLRAHGRAGQTERAEQERRSREHLAFLRAITLRNLRGLFW